MLVYKKIANEIWCCEIMHGFRGSSSKTSKFYWDKNISQIDLLKDDEVLITGATHHGAVYGGYTDRYSKYSTYFKDIILD